MGSNFLFDEIEPTGSEHYFLKLFALGVLFLRRTKTITTKAIEAISNVIGKSRVVKLYSSSAIRAKISLKTIIIKKLNCSSKG